MIEFYYRWETKILQKYSSKDKNKLLLLLKNQKIPFLNLLANPPTNNYLLNKDLQ